MGKALFFVNMSLFKAYIIYRANTDTPLKRKEVLVSIVDSLVKSMEHPVVPGPAGDGAGHSVAHLPGQLRLCDVCSKDNKS